jgi:hypothetical protein
MPDDARRAARAPPSAAINLQPEGVPGGGGRRHEREETGACTSSPTLSHYLRPRHGRPDGDRLAVYARQAWPTGAGAARALQPLA